LEEVSCPLEQSVVLQKDPITNPLARSTDQLNLPRGVGANLRRYVSMPYHTAQIVGSFALAATPPKTPSVNHFFTC
jgi:hypothetical protein